MHGSDMTVVRKVEGTWVAEDRYARASVTPQLDAAADVNLLAAEASAGRTSILFQRPTRTCQTGEEDLVLADVETAVIVAWGDSHDFAYHTPARRATAWLNLFSPRPPAEAEGVGGEALREHEVRVNRHAVPADKSTVYCYSGHTLPQDKKYHVVRAEPVLNSSHPELVHHMIIYICLQELDASFLNQTSRGAPVCEEGMKQKGMCYTLWVMWGFGSKGVQLPPEAGLPMGKAAGDISSARSVMLEVHYDNPNNVRITDGSGFKLFYTDKLRPNDAVVMTLGHLGIDIPPGQVSHKHINECGGACTKRLKKPLTVIWAGLHMHNTGKSIGTQHFRGAEELAPLGRKSSFDFNQQSPVHVNAVIEPGDRLVTTCEYSSTSRDTPTRFGEGSDDEMCFNFMLVYPAQGLLMCMEIGALSAAPNSDKMGICLDNSKSGSLQDVLSMSRSTTSLTALSDISIKFEAPPTEIIPYRDPVCAARAKLASGAPQAVSACRAATLLLPALVVLLGAMRER